MPFHKNLGAYSGKDIPKGGVKISNSDRMHSSKHINMMKRSAKKKGK